MATYTLLFIVLTILAVFSVAAFAAYKKGLFAKRKEVGDKSTSINNFIDNDLSFGIETVDFTSFVAWRITALSTMGVPGKPYNVAAFSNKVPGAATPNGVVLRRRKNWILKGGVSYFRPTANRF